MLTLEKSMEHQRNLEELCRDRGLITNELFEGNAFYGIASAIKQYVSLPESYSLKVVIPHGVYLDVSLLWPAEKLVPLPVVLCYPENRIQIYKERTKKKVIPSCSPFNYVVELMKDQAIPERKGTIFFPHHSTHHVTVEMDYQLVAEELLKLDEKYQPVTICIYWRDYNLGHHKPFTDRGFNIVSAGHIFDNLFLFRLYHLLSLHKYASGNGIGSQIFYSIKAGCSYFHYDIVNYESIGDEYQKRTDVPQIPNDFMTKLKTRFSIKDHPSLVFSEEFSGYYLGSEYFYSSDDLRKILMNAEILDKSRFANHSNGKLSVFLPTYFYRLLHIAGIKSRMCGLVKGVNSD